MAQERAGGLAPRRVLGANDGIVSTASLVVGVAAAAAGRNDILLAGTAGLVSGASAWTGAGRVAFRGALAMATTAGAGALFGTTLS